MTIPFLRPDARAAFLAQHEPDHGTPRDYRVTLTATDTADSVFLEGEQGTDSETVTVTASDCVAAKAAAQMQMTLTPMGRDLTVDVVRGDA